MMPSYTIEKVVAHEDEHYETGLPGLVHPAIPSGLSVPEFRLLRERIIAELRPPLQTLEAAGIIGDFLMDSEYSTSYKPLSIEALSRVIGVTLEAVTAIVSYLKDSGKIIECSFKGLNAYTLPK